MLMGKGSSISVVCVRVSCFIFCNISFIGEGENH